MPDRFDEIDPSPANVLPQRIPCDLGIERWEPASVELYERIMTGLRNTAAGPDLPGVGVSSPPTPGSQPSWGDMYRNTLRNTETQDRSKAVDWTLDNGSVRIRNFRIRGDANPAYQYPNKPMPSAMPGTVYFDDTRPPDLVQVREWFPKHEDLWNAVRDDLWPALLNTDGRP